MKTIHLSINRIGTFKVSKKQAHISQCGTVKVTDYEYFVRIEATNKRLIKPDNFVLDNMIVKDYFDTTYVKGNAVCKSCEDMACDALNYFKSLFIGKKAPYKFIDLQKITVKIHGSKWSYIEAVWEKKK